MVVLYQDILDEVNNNISYPNKKNIIRRAETINKKYLIFLDSLYEYCCKPSQRMGNRLGFF
jgi:hypothetical protein